MRLTNTFLSFYRIDHEMSALTPALYGPSTVTSSSHVTELRASATQASGVEAMVNAEQMNINNAVRQQFVFCYIARCHIVFVYTIV